MATLVVIGYETAEKAEEVRTALMGMQQEYLIELADAVVAVRDEHGKVSLRQLYSTTAAGAASGGFWGALIGMVFLNPLFGMAIGAAAGAISGALTDVGIDDGFLSRLANTLKPGTAALCVLIRKMTADKVVEEIRQYGGTVLHTSLSHEDENKLKAALASAQEHGVMPPPTTTTGA